jgi:hypothetical protein
MWIPLVVGISQIDHIFEFCNAFLRIEAHVETNCAGSCEISFPTGLCFYFFPGPRNRKMNFKKLGFRLGPDLVILSTTTHPTRHFLLLEHCACSFAPTPIPRSGLALCGFRALGATGQ